MSSDPTTRFSDRVEDYIRFRPGYPAEMITVLEKEIGLDQEKIIADIGSGTGLSSIPFLKNGNIVYGVEPNQEMRAAQEQILRDFENFRSINGASEQTKLPDKSVDIIFSGQAFHWFDKKAGKKEFVRILKDNGNIVLVWNERSTKSAFQKAYEQILFNHISEYRNVTHRNIEGQDIESFFSPKPMKTAVIDNTQIFDLDGLKGRLKSASYCPKSGDAYEKLMQEIELLFSKYQQEGRVAFEYETRIYWC